jgi:5-formyltetrahydrofolate cyclo-ligase
VQYGRVVGAIEDRVLVPTATGRCSRDDARPGAEGGGVTKDALRARVWRLMRARRVARFPFPIEDRIPNFAGAEDAAARAADLPEWRRARRLKMNPDAPQRPLRLRALRDGKTVFMAVPRLRTEACFVRLDPAKLGARIVTASSIGGAAKLGEPVVPADLGRIDLVVAGSVAVDSRGGRVGKGGGYSDLEWAVARELGRVDDDTPVLTTVHALQVVRAAIPMTEHDVPVDLVVTPERVIRTRGRPRKPAGVRWQELSDAQVRAMPVLARLAAALRRDENRE